MRVLAESDMMELVRDYLWSDSIRPLTVGGIVGTQIFQHVIDAVMEYTTYDKIRIIEGIQDIIGLHKEIPLNNHNFYAELFVNDLITVPRDTSTIEGFLKKDDGIRYKPILKTIFKADVIIINDTQMIPSWYLNPILENSHTKIICIVDPLDMYSESYFDVPTIIDTLHKLPALMIQARSLYGIESRAIEKKVFSVLDKQKISKRSIGRLDDAQYVTNDIKLFDEVQQKQIDQKFKKNQKLMVLADTHVIRSIIVNETPVQHEPALTRFSMVQIDQASDSMLYYRMRVYSSRSYIYGRPTYNAESNEGNMHVIPANILTPMLAGYHRYKHIIYVPSSKALTKRQAYTMLKSTNRLTIAE